MYVKLFSDIVLSSLNEQPLSIRCIFMLLLSQSDKHGFVQGTDSTLRRVLNVTADEWDSAIDKLTSPDPDSKSPAEEGRRLLRVNKPPGFQIVNYAGYRDIKDEKSRREYFRNYMRGYRSPAVNIVNSVNKSVSIGTDTVTSEKEAEDFTLPPPYNTPELSEVWARWLQFRRELRKKVTPMSAKQHIKLLQQWGAKKWTDAINQSITCGWQGLFEPKQSSNTKPSYNGPNM